MTWVCLVSRTATTRASSVLDELPSELQAENLRRLLGLRKSIRPSDRQRATLARFSFRRDKPSVSSGFIAPSEAGRP